MSDEFKGFMSRHKILSGLGVGAVFGAVVGLVGGGLYRAMLPGAFYAQTQPTVTSVYYTSNGPNSPTTLADNLFIRTDTELFVARPVRHSSSHNSYTGMGGQDVRIVPVDEAKPILAAHVERLKDAEKDNQFAVISPMHASDSDMTVRSPNVLDTYVNEIKFYKFMDEKVPRIVVYGAQNPLRVGQPAGSLATRDIRALETLEKSGGLKGPAEFEAYCRKNQVAYLQWPIVPFYWGLLGSMAVFPATGMAIGGIAALATRRDREARS